MQTTGGRQQFDTGMKIRNLRSYHLCSPYRILWNGPEGWNCGLMGSDPCGAGPGSCGDKNDRGDVNNPGGWMILQSFTTFHNVSQIIY